MAKDAISKRLNGPFSPKISNGSSHGELFFAFHTHLGMVVLALVLNQTQTVSSWFVPDEIAEILKILDERTADNPPERLPEARDRVKALAIDASRGRSKAIRELVNLDYATLGVRVKHTRSAS